MLHVAFNGWPAASWLARTKRVLSVLLVLVLLLEGLEGCTADPQSGGRPVPPNYYIHQLSLEGGGG